MRVVRAERCNDVRVIVRIHVLVATATLLGACTAAGPSGPAQSTVPPSGSHQSSSAASGPIDSGPLRARDASSCPYLRAGFVHDTIGMRLGRLAVLRRDGRVVGCRFYALQRSPQTRSEHLPGPKQPVVEVLTQRYHSAKDAHNAFVIAAEQGTNAQRVDIGPAPGVCFQKDFYWKDHGTDWACATNVGSTEVVVRTVDNTGTFNAVALTQAALAHV